MLRPVNFAMFQRHIGNEVDYACTALSKKRERPSPKAAIPTRSFPAAFCRTVRAVEILHEVWTGKFAPPVTDDHNPCLVLFLNGSTWSYDCGTLVAPDDGEMLKGLNLRQYRGFESYQLADLARVNLVVGKNNSGKTSILEAVELLLSEGSPSALVESVERREEFRMGARYEADLSHVFHGHRCTPGASFELSSSPSHQRLTGQILSIEEVGEDADRWEMMVKRYPGHDRNEEPVAAFGLSLAFDQQRPTVLPITENGSLIRGPWSRTRSNGHSRRSASFLNLKLSSMQSAWNAVLEEGREKEIVEAMHILMPKIDSIHFLVGDRRQGILVGQKGVQPRLPIGSYGDGMRRLLAISLALVGTKNGCLLIDEIDTGLHWTVMEDMWRLVVEAAQRSNVQVFATTHSYDCIRGLGALIKSQPDLSESVAIQKVHRSLEQAVCIPGKDIPIVVEQDIEVR